MIKNTASQIVSFQLISATDGSNVTSGSPTVYVLGDGGSQGSGSGTVAHEGNGCWSYAPTQAETNYNHVAFTIVLAGSISQTVNVYLVTLADYKADVSGLATAAALATVDGIVDTIVARVIGTIAAGTHTAQSGDAYARLGTPAGASVSADILAIDNLVDDLETRCTEARLSELDAGTAGKMANQVDIIQTDTTTDIPATITTMQGNVTTILSDTNDLQVQIGTAGAGLASIPWNASWDAQVQSECKDALDEYDPPTKAELDTAVANVSVDEIQESALADLFNTDSGTAYASAVAGSVVKEIADNAGGSSLTAGDIADAVKTAVEADGSHLTLIKAKTDNLPADPADQSAVEAAIPTADEIALAILKKDWTGVTGEAARSLLNAVRFLRNKWSVSGGTLTVTKEDDTTAAWTASVTGDAAADPIIGSTPL